MFPGLNPPWNEGPETEFVRSTDKWGKIVDDNMMRT